MSIACILEGWTYGHLSAMAYEDGDLWVIKSDCGQVSIKVLSNVAEQRIASGGLPVFYYE